MASTRLQNANTALQHVLNELGMESGSNATLVLQASGITRIFDLIMLTREDLIALETTTSGDDGTVIRLTILQVRSILKLVDWYNSQHEPTIRTWFDLTSDVFDAFIVTGGTPNLPGIDTVNVQRADDKQAINDFQKGTKRNVSDYPKLSDDKYWFNYARKLKATAAAHGIAEVLDPDYVPDLDNEELFNAKNTFIYSVFVSTLQTGKSRRCVRMHQATMDGQAVYIAMEKEYTQGATAELAAERLRLELLKFKLDDKWSKSNEQFLDVWETKVQDLEQIQDTEVSEDRKREWLTTAIRPHAELYRAVFDSKLLTATMAILGSSSSGVSSTSSASTKLPFDGLYSLVRQYAIELDGQKEAKKKNRQVHKSNQSTVYNGRQQGHNNNRGRNNSANSNAGNGKDYSKDTRNRIDKSEWSTMSYQQRKEFIQARKARGAHRPRQGSNNASQPNHNGSNNRSYQANNIQVSDDSASTSGQSMSTSVPSSASVGGSTVATTGTGSQAPGSAIQRMLSMTQSTPSGQPSVRQAIVYEGRTYYANTIKAVYSFQHANVHHKGSLVDGGANGGLAGSDVRVLATGFGKADVTGIGENTISNLDLCTVAGVVDTTSGPVVGIFHQYANHGQGTTIHSANQLAAFGQDVNERPKSLPGGRQSIITVDGYVIPLAIRQGLPYMDMHPPSDEEMESLPHVVFTSDKEWDPHNLDIEVDPMAVHGGEEAADFMDENLNLTYEADNMMMCIYDARHAKHHTSPIVLPEGMMSPSVIHGGDNSTGNGEVLLPDKPKHVYKPKSILPVKPDYEALQPYFGWIPPERIKDTLKCTTQWYKMSQRYPLRKHFKTRFPAANVSRLHDTVATDTFFSDTPAYDDGVVGHGGATMVQVYVGVRTRLTEGYPMKSESQFSSTLLDFIRHHGAPDVLMSDNAKSETSKKVYDILRNFCVEDHQSEPDYQNQNPAERRIQDIKRTVNGIMDRTGTPAPFWLICVLYVIHLFNHLAQETAGNITPLQAAHGQQPDISKFLSFYWWQPVYYRVESPQFPSQSKERRGRWAGPCLHKGDELTFWILDDETGQLLPRSDVRAATKQDNLRIAMQRDDNGEDDADASKADGSSNDAVHSLSDLIAASKGLSSTQHVKLPKFTPEQLIGLTYLHDTGNGEKVRATVLKKLQDHSANNHQNIKMLVGVGEDKNGEQIEELIAYTELSDCIEEQHRAEMAQSAGGDDVFTFQEIVGHEGPLKPKHANYKGSKYNVMVKWDDGSVTSEPLHIMIKDDPVSCAKYGYDHNLLDQPGWKRVKRLGNRQKKLARMVKAAKSQAKKNAPMFKFGVQIPKNHKQAMELDAKNGNTKWADAEQKEKDQLFEYGTFRSLGKGARKPYDHKQIVLLWVYDVKHDLRHKARCVAGGHLTDPCKDMAYAGVVSLRSLRIALVAGELNGLKSMVGDIGNAYLEAYTKEKICFVAGPEWGEYEGHMMVIVKALYGLRTSGARFHESLADTLRDMGFTQCKSDPDVWMHNNGRCWEYVCVYVDDLMAIMEDPQTFFNTLMEFYKYKLKGVGDLKYHLGADFGRDKDGTLYMSSQSYIKRMLENYSRMFGAMPYKYTSPLMKDDSPELDVSEELDHVETKKYQSLIGALQWCITLGRFDISVAVMTLSRFRANPRKGHMERAKRVCGYLRRHSDGAIRFRCKIPRHEEHFQMDSHDWMYTVYGNAGEDITDDIPTPMGKPVRTTSFVDANLLHCKVTGKSATGILTMVNQTPIDWFSKRQATVETATYGSEFVAARIATEQIIALRIQLRDMGIPIDGPSWMFGDNRSVITSSTIPSSMLSKRHNALAYHRVRAAVAAKVLYFCKIDGKENVADIMTKFLPWVVFWPLIKPLLFWKGETNQTDQTDKKHENRN